MKKDSTTTSAVIPASPEDIYKAWMSSSGHSAMTGSKAQVTPRVGGKYSAWDGYIAGKTLELEPPMRIVQTWRSTDFSAEDEDSRLEIVLAKARGGTKVTLKHTNIPRGQAAEYKKGWVDFYFKPMKKYFSGKA